LVDREFLAFLSFRDFDKIGIQHFFGEASIPDRNSFKTQA